MGESRGGTSGGADAVSVHRSPTERSGTLVKLSDTAPPAHPLRLEAKTGDCALIPVCCGFGTFV